MFKPVTASLVLFCLCAPAAAQIGGSANRAAPTLTENITFPSGAMLEVSYKSATWAEGRMMKALTDKEEGEGTRSAFNRRAAGSPLGSLQAKMDFTVGGKTVAAGEYDLYFTIDEDLKWHLVLANKTTDGPNIDWLLALEEGDKHRTRLGIDLGAGDDNNTGELRISFGYWHCVVPFAAASDDGE